VPFRENSEVFSNIRLIIDGYPSAFHPSMGFEDAGRFIDANAYLAGDAVAV
jgi:hypothetical protein